MVPTWSDEVTQVQVLTFTTKPEVQREDFTVCFTSSYYHKKAFVICRDFWEGARTGSGNHLYGPRVWLNLINFNKIFTVYFLIRSYT